MSMFGTATSSPLAAVNRLKATLRGLAYVADAPTGTGRYVRLNGAWSNINGRYALIGGSATRKFAVAAATANSQAVPLSQAQSVAANQAAAAVAAATAWTRITAATTATTGAHLLADSSGGAFTVTLPAAPAVGDVVTVRGVGGAVPANNVTIARNGNNIAGQAADFIIDKDNFQVDMVYNSAARGWEY